MLIHLSQCSPAPHPHPSPVNALFSKIQPSQQRASHEELFPSLLRLFIQCLLYIRSHPTHLADTVANSIDQKPYGVYLGEEAME